MLAIAIAIAIAIAVGANADTHPLASSHLFTGSNRKPSTAQNREATASIRKTTKCQGKSRGTAQGSLPCQRLDHPSNVTKTKSVDDVT